MIKTIHKYYFYIFISMIFSCAEIVAPSGGEKDTTAPIVIKSKPENQSIFFSEKFIEITFDEFIKIDASAGNIVTSPPLSKSPKFETIGKKIRIVFQEELRQKTTYIINFGSSIKDYNEGNILQNYKFVFSTGDFIDSMSVSGTIKNAFNNHPVENVIVGLYLQNSDSVLYKKPLYITKTNKHGKYKIENIKEGKYKIAALEDKNLNYIFDQEAERIGFIEKTIDLKTPLEKVDIFIFNNYKENRIISKKNEENHLTVEYLFPFQKIESNIKHSDKNYFYKTIGNKSFHYWYSSSYKDSIATILVDNITDSVTLKKTSEKKTLFFSFKSNSTLVNNKNKIALEFPFPIKTINSKKLHLKNRGKYIDYALKLTNNKTVLEILTDKKHDTIQLSIDSACFTSYANNLSIQTKEQFTVFKDNTSTLSITLPETENIQLELYNSEDALIKKQNVSRETKVVFKNMAQQKYSLRIYIDENKNGLWDSGFLKTKRQAEKTLIYKEVEIKDAWDKEISFAF